MIQKIKFWGFFMREASRMRTAVQSRNVKVRNYKSLFGRRKLIVKM